MPDSSDPSTAGKAQAQAKDTSPSESTWLGLSFAWELGYTIALPAVLFGIGGAYLDKHFHTSPFIVLGGLVFAFIISLVAVTKKIRVILGRMPQDAPRRVKPADDSLSEAERLHAQFRPKS